MAQSQTPVLPYHNDSRITVAHSASANQTPPQKKEEEQQTTETASGRTSLSASPLNAPPGYPKLAELMNILPETSIFRRFGTLNSLNLLYLQAELTDIENKLRQAQVADHNTREGYKKFYAKNWYFLKESAQDGGDEQLQLVNLARKKLDKYNATLIQQERILAFRSPGTYEMDYIRRYLASDEIGEPYPLTGDDSDTWGTFPAPNTHADDLVTLKPRRDEDGFSNWIIGRGIAKFFELGGARFGKPSVQHGGRVSFQDTVLLRITYSITSMLASLLPIASIAVLYVVHSMKIRLLLIAIFNVLVTLCLTTFTTAKRTEVFAVAAAFSAVQVVFVQGGDTADDKIPGN